VSIIDVFRWQAEARRASSAAIPDAAPLGSPWSTSDLSRAVWRDIFGDVDINTRAAAMRIPTITRARRLLVTQIARCQLIAMKAGAPLLDQPSWLYATDIVSPAHRMAWTVDDLIFYGASLWWRDNAAPSSGGFPLRAQRVEFGAWEITPDLKCLVNGVEVDDNQVILIPGFDEGLLAHGSDVLRDARDLYKIVRQRLKNPIPQLELHQTGGADLTDDEIDKLIAQWAAARAGENGGVAFTNRYIEVIERGAGGDSQLMIEARNAAAVDLARSIGVSAGMVDATAPKASLNYETQSGRNAEFIDLDLRAYMTPIETRLSMDDCVPSGTVVAFDVSTLNAIPEQTSDPRED
jgi:hypothetical protein